MINRLTLLKFEFKTPLHISNVRSDYGKSEKMFHSDSLYSAIIEAWNILGLTIPDFTEKQLEFAVSSLFPYFSQGNENDEIYFFPKPLGSLPIVDQNFEFHKKIKRVQYIDLQNYIGLLANGKMQISNEENIKGEFYTSNDKFDKDFMSSSVYMRNSIPREENRDTQLYYVDRIYFHEHCGLFCLATFENDEIRNKVISALKYLQDEGIGTDRHIGNGLFDLKIIDTFDKFDQLQITSEYFTNLSLFCPENKAQLDAMIEDKARYQFKKRGGWITSEPYTTLRKKSVNMFNEGSVFKTEKSSDILIKGKTVDLKPDTSILPHHARNIHSIFRVGRSVFLPICV